MLPFRPQASSHCLHQQQHKQFTVGLLRRSTHVHGRCFSCCVARFKHSSDLDDIVQQAKEAPQITVQQPDLLVAAPRQQQQQLQQQQHAPRSPATHTRAADAYAAVPRSPEQQQPQQQQQQLDQLVINSSKLRPSRMDFATMYAQLAAWQQRFLTAHVPRHCFDAPELGAWVRYVRKQHKDGHLEQWKADSLSALGFEWELSDQAAKWHHLYHQLRRYRALYGTTDVDVTRSSQDGCDWRLVAWWLHKQARLLAKQKLSAQQRAMLQQLGVRLTVPKQLVQRTAQLQALNGPERRKLRKKWKLQDNMHHEAARQQRQQELQALLQQRRQQRETEHRRRQLMQQAAAAAVGGAAADGSETVQPLPGSAPAQQEALVRIAVQQLQIVHQLAVHQPQQQPLVQPQALLGLGTFEVLPAPRQRQKQPPRQAEEQQSAQLSQGLSQAVSAELAQSQQQRPPRQQLQQHHGDGGKPTVQATQPLPSPPPQQQQQRRELESLPQQQVPAVVEAGALLFQPNRRRKKVARKSRHERWLADTNSP